MSQGKMVISPGHPEDGLGNLSEDQYMSQGKMALYENSPGYLKDGLGHLSEDQYMSQVKMVQYKK